MNRNTLLGLTAGLLHASVASAAPFEIVDRVNFNALLDAAADSMEDSVNNGFLSTAQRMPLLENMAKAATSGTSTLLADRSGRPTVMVAAVALQTGFSGGSYTAISGAGTNTLPPVGASGQGAVVLGIPGSNLGFGKSGKDATLYLSGGGASIANKGVQFTMFNLGANLAYQLTPEVGASFLAKWGGLKFVTGLNYAKGRLGYGGTLSQTSGTTSVTMNMDMNVETSNLFLPLEFSTSLQVLYMFRIYLGGALDLNFGGAKFAGVSTGPFETGVPGSTATAQLNLDDGIYAVTSKAVARGFIGGEINLYAIRAGIEYTSLSNQSESLGVYARIGL